MYILISLLNFTCCILHLLLDKFLIFSYSHTILKLKYYAFADRILCIVFLLPTFYRYLFYYKQLRQKHKKPCMDFFNQIPLRQIYGKLQGVVEKLPTF